MLVSKQLNDRYTAFWDRTPTDRACLYINRWDGSPGYPGPANVTQQWLDLDWRTESTVYGLKHSLYDAEGFPTAFVNFGPGSLAACVGTGFIPHEATIWFETKPHVVEDWASRPRLSLHKDSRMYGLVENLTYRLLAHKDELITSICDIGGTYDIIASLRGTNELLYDLYDEPEAVKALRDELAPIWAAYFREQSDRLIREQGGMTSWMPIWSDKPYYPLQSDFCAMISPDMFREFILPDLCEQTELMPRSIYHLDGPREIPHLDMILSMPRLNAIQWVQGSGQPGPADPCWYELYHRIQAAGKGLILLGVAPWELEPILKNVSQRGLYISTWAGSEEEAEQLIRLAEKLNH